MQVTFFVFLVFVCFVDKTSVSFSSCFCGWELSGKYNKRIIDNFPKFSQLFFFSKGSRGRKKKIGILPTNKKTGYEE